MVIGQLIQKCVVWLRREDDDWILYPKVSALRGADQSAQCNIFLIQGCEQGYKVIIPG